MPSWRTLSILDFFWILVTWEAETLSLKWGKKSVTAPVRRGLEGQGGILMRRGGRGSRSIGTCVPHMCDTCSIRCLGATKNALGGNSALPHVYRSGCLFWRRVKDSHTCPKFFLPHQKLCASCANCVYTLKPYASYVPNACTKVEWWTEMNLVAFDMWSVYIILSVSRQLYISTTVRSIGSLFHFCRSKCDKLSITKR